jgi:ATP-dependent RNA helicase TDRD9
LPFCKTVVDFCLTRKNITIKIKGYSRFETRVASKANLLQRAGRVGRISDGVVYRLISKELYSKLDEFDIPEIQCVSLDMVILRAKQIDKTYNSKLF